MDARTTFVVDYKHHKYLHATTVKHHGCVVAFAMDDQGAIYYTVLDPSASDGDSDGRATDDGLDASLWPKAPARLAFPSELVAAQPGSRSHRLSAPARAPAAVTPEDGTTARFTARVPFQAMSIGQYVYVFRQAAVDGSTAQELGDARLHVLSGNLLVDRFTLVDRVLANKRDVRFRRSRQKEVPHSKTDSLGPTDMEDQPFVEPTLVLDFVRGVEEGRFSVQLLETLIPTIQRWLIFACNSATRRVDWFSIEQSPDGLFNPQGTQLYTSASPDHQHVLESEPGDDPFVAGGKLVPVLDGDDAPSPALDMARTPGILPLTHPIELHEARGWTIEVWLNWPLDGLKLESIPMPDDPHRKVWIGRRQVLVGFQGGWASLDFHPQGRNAVNVGAGSSQLCGPLPITDGWHHLAVTVGPDSMMSCYLDGHLARRQISPFKSRSSDGPLLVTTIGSSDNGRDRPSGRFNELRFWDGPRSAEAILAHYRLRIPGAEPGLLGCWPCDEGAGTRVRDVSGRDNHLSLPLGDAWSVVGAPLGDPPGIRSGSFEMQDRAFGAGIATVKYAQREHAATGYDHTPKPQKRAARVMLAIATTGSHEDKNAIAVLDMAIDGRGRIVAPPALVDFDTCRLPSPPDPSQGRVLDAQLASDKVRVPMKLLACNAGGLTLSGGLLEFAYSNEVPWLHESATGLVTLYFRGARDNAFFAAYYDTAAERAVRTLNFTPGGVASDCDAVFRARSLELELDWAKVEVSGDDPHFCDVRIAQFSGPDEKTLVASEDWLNVSRQPGQFCSTLNGDFFEPVFVGMAESNAEGTHLAFASEDVHALLKGTPLQLGEGALLTLGGKPYRVKALHEPAPGSAGTIELDTALPEPLRPLQIPPVSASPASAGAAFSDTWDTLNLKAPLQAAIFAGNLLQIGDVRVTVTKLARTGTQRVEIEPFEAELLSQELSLLQKLNPLVAVGIVSADGALYREVGQIDLSGDHIAGIPPLQSSTVNGLIFRLDKRDEALLDEAARSGRNVKVSRGGVSVPAQQAPFDQPVPCLHNARDWDRPVHRPGDFGEDGLPYIVRFDPQPCDAVEWTASLCRPLSVQRLLYDPAGATATAGTESVPILAGSRFFFVQPGAHPKTIRNGRTSIGPTKSNAWVAAAPGTAYTFHDDGRSSLTGDTGPEALRSFEPELGMTIECWALPRPLTTDVALVSYRHEAGRVRYVLGMRPVRQNWALRLDRSLSLQSSSLIAFAQSPDRGDTIDLWFRTTAPEVTLACLYTAVNASDRPTLGGKLPDHAQVHRGLYLRKGRLCVAWAAAAGTQPILVPTLKNDCSDGRWHHVSLSTVRSRFEVFVDDERQALLDSTLPPSPLDLPAQVSMLSCIEGTGHDHSLLLQNVRLWNEAHDLGQVLADKTQRGVAGAWGLIAGWRFEDDTDEVAASHEPGKAAYGLKDFSGHGNEACVLAWSDPVPLPPSSIRRDAGPETFPADGYRAFMGVGYRTGAGTWTSRFVQSTDVMAFKGWRHLVAIPHIASGVALNAGDYIDCGAGQSLNVGESFAIEIFFQATDFSQPRGLLTKGGRTPDGTGPTRVAYALRLEQDTGQLVFEFDGRDGQRHRFPAARDSSLCVPAGKYCKASVMRTRTRSSKAMQDDSFGIEVVDTYTIVCSWEGKPAASKPWTFLDKTSLDPCDNAEPLEIGRAYVTAQGNGADMLAHFGGFVGECRLWTSGIEPRDAGAPVGDRASQLAGHWNLREGKGLVVHDACGENTGRLKLIQPTRDPWSPNPDPSVSTVELYIDGTRVRADTMAEPPGFGERDGFHIGAMQTSDGRPTACFAGALAELRVWNVERTRGQILNNLFGRLKGDTADLVSGYPFDVPLDGALADMGPRRNHLRLPAAGKTCFVLSTAPIGEDTPQVRSALARVKTSFNDRITSRPAVEEYAVIERDLRGRQVGVMKRCYTFTSNGVWRVISGFKVGNLALEWVGQVQSRPTLVGYIEGAPPVPSENLTSTGLKLGEYADYKDASTVEIVEANSVTYAYATSSANSATDASAWMAAARTDFSIDTGVALGAAVLASALKVETDHGIKAGLEKSIARADEQAAAVTNTTSKISSLGLRGAWELYPLNPSMGRRWVPDNWGLAVVQSDTMDMFALRLAHNDAIVGYQLVPNPDIPKDWNLIEFPINPAYTKQGTLDGKVGCREDGTPQLDVDYPQADQHGQWSYFKPREAYALKRSIDRTKARLESDHAKRTVSAAAPEISRSPEQQLQASRSMANTYVWTAAGGFFAESTDVVESVHESSSGSYTFSSSVGVAFDLKATIAGIGGHVGFDFMHGQQVESIKTKSKSSERSFSLNVQVTGEPDLQLYVNTPTEASRYEGFLLENAAAFDKKGEIVKRPGKVDAYRFMSFYLEPDHRHTQDFFAKVVDPVWLAQSTAPKAVALRQARGDAKASPWRVMHRVTFVSRILPESSPDVKNPDPFVKALRDEGIESNWGLLQALGPFVQGRTSDPQAFEDAIFSTLETDFPGLARFKRQVLAIAELYFDVPARHGGTASGPH